MLLHRPNLDYPNVDSKGREYNWDELTEYGFKDIDPEELFSGKSPKFGGHHEA